MKRLILFLIAILSAQLLPAQVHYIEKGSLTLGIRVTVDQEEIKIDSLVDSLDPETGMPNNLVIPQGSVIGIVHDKLRNWDRILSYYDNRRKGYLSDLETQMSGFTSSSAAGSKRSYTLIDTLTKDTIQLKWSVGYNPIKMLDLIPGDQFEQSIAYQMRNVFEPYPDRSQIDWSDKNYVTELNERGIPVNPVFPYSENSLYFLHTMTVPKTQIQLVGYHDKPQNFDENYPYKLLYYKDLPPGDYVYTAYPYEGAPDRLALKYPFTILPPWWSSTSSIIGFTLVGTLVVAGSLFSIYKTRQNRKTKELEWTKKLTEAELTAIRAQLNPHFLFNALSSIQNLVSAGRNDEASTFITKLSQLLRKVLTTSEKHFHELEEELEILTLYMELEKLRHGFSYTIEVDPGVDIHTLVPAMMLQPYAENAVKHGVAALEKKGKITIRIQQDSNDLVVDILDNGPGLSSPNIHSSGLKLGEDRIQSLNQLYSTDARVQVENRKEGSGVRARITLPLTDEL